MLMFMHDLADFLFCEAVGMCLPPFDFSPPALPRDHMQAMKQEVPAAYNHGSSANPQQRYKQYWHFRFSFISKTYFVV